MLSKREQAILQDIKHWEQQLLEQESTDFQKMFDKWLHVTFAKLPEKKRNDFMMKADGWLFHLHAFIQSSQSQLDARNRILGTARLFDDSIEQMEDMKSLSIDQLAYIAEQQTARHRLYSFVQGGVAGVGGLLLLTADFPVMIGLNVKAVQLIATSFGHDVNKPYEMMLALKVFHASLLPARLQQYAWYNLLQELEQEEAAPFFYEGDEEVLNPASVQVVLKQIMKTFSIYALRRKLFQGIPVLGMAIGSTVNYRLTRNVTEFANRFYQVRYILEKEKA
ncbi:EcsC family protein [Bacillus sp. DX1.1]|uniref:EcsC family protein n=1 Tax=unclassified Bacillus (in: firmicutes) TaxID=185979 RepID=UPI00257123A1|nr:MULTISPECIES: EcsC family protein [unclassified Bacillus (in: firmicutes)]MDM5156806.1 EcsC family protein [Bacillus sp. DX1.1]WJE81053.1 EcsC family protein [Bacillus sp. DX3.1]